VTRITLKGGGRGAMIPEYVTPAFKAFIYRTFTLVLAVIDKS